MGEHEPLRTLIDDYLAAHQRLQTPVATFASEHERRGPAMEPFYRNLIPLSAPAEDEQYAFEVDLDRCTGCKACVSGCHSLNGLDEGETWRDVGLLVNNSGDASCGATALGYQQTVTTACHHCADPGCLNGCPVLAYEKDPVTGIVRHLDDQCIGCQYCVLKCPYDVPKYNERLGIVRKCDMCHSRLAEGEAPACVQSCPTQAIRIVKVTVTRGEAPAADTSRFLPAAPAPDYTQPTTRYVSKAPIPAGVVAGDAGALRPQPAHWPLVFMLVLTQAGLGLLAAALILQPSAAAPAVHGVLSEAHAAALHLQIAPAVSGAPEVLSSATAASSPIALNAASWWQPDAPDTFLLAGALLFLAGLAASVAHLGQPLRAWRVFLNLRKSWLSREALLLGASAAPLAAGLLGRFTARLPYPFSAPALNALTPLSPALLTAAAGVGALGLLCSAMLYIDTRRPLWRPSQSLTRFLGTFLIAALIVLSPQAAVTALALKLAFETLTQLSPAPRGTPAFNTRRLLLGPLASLALARLSIALAAIPALLTDNHWLGLLLVLAGETLERALFFRSVVAPKMPGVPAS